MRFPKPTFQFIIPSVYDKTPLDCRIYRPCSIDPNSELRNWGTRGAIVAHPYAALGGCYDDSVVKTVVEVLINHGYTVLTFNFRYLYLFSLCQDNGEDERIALIELSSPPTFLNLNGYCFFFLFYVAC